MKKRKMEAKTKAIEKIILSRRILATLKLMEESKLCSVALFQLQRKHLQLLQQLHFLHTAKISLGFETSSYKKENMQAGWEENCQLDDESVFRHKFRMGRNIFHKLCELLPGLQKSFTKLGKRVTLQKGVAVALYALGSTEEYRKIGKIFGVKEATVINIILRFCEEVWKFLAPKYLDNFPLKKEKLEIIMEGFEALGFPQCMGALDSCQIAVKYPNDSCAQNSVKLLALVDARCRFIYVRSGSPGYWNDSQVYQESSLKQYIEQCGLLSELQKNISDVDVPVLMIGDSTFQLSENLMTPYPIKTLQTQQQKLFNNVLSKSLKIAKNAILQLRARFRRFGKGVDDTIGNSNAIILSCCVLHNFLSENNDVINEEWLHVLPFVESERLYTEQSILPGHLNNNPKAIRLAIASYFSGKEISDDDEYENLDNISASGSFKAYRDPGDSSADGNNEFTDFDNGSIFVDELMSE